MPAPMSLDLRLRIVAAVEGDRARPVATRRDHIERGQPFGAAQTRVNRTSTISPERFSIRPWPMKQSLASMPGPLRYSRASGSVVLAGVAFERTSRGMTEETHRAVGRDFMEWVLSLLQPRVAVCKGSTKQDDR